MAVAIQDYSARDVRWDLSSLFSSMTDPRIEETWSKAHAGADAFASAYRGKVESSSLDAASLETALRELESLTNESVKPVLYANLLFAADTSNPEHGGFLQAQTEKMSELRVKLMFFELELQAAANDYVERLLGDEALANYVHFVKTTRAFSPHRLTEIEEVLLEETANTGSRAWQRLHDELTSNHVYKYTDPGSGESSDLSQEEILELLRDPDRKVRQAAADSLSAGLEQLQRTIVFLYNTLLADKRLEDRLRRYEHPESSRHLANELDKGTVDLVMQLCKENNHVVARYYRVKRELLGLDELTHVDRYAPLFESRQKKTWEEAQKIVLDSFESFSGEMASAAKAFFDNSWIDAEPRQGKSGGAFCSPNTTDTHPVLLQSYMGDLNDVMTLAHEMGHGVHAYLSREQTPFNYNGTLPLAELASIFAEMVTFERIVAGADLEDRMALYAQKIEGIFASVHRQASMFRFEQRCHEKRRSDGELTAEDFGTVWQEEIQAMFGDAVRLGEQHRLWWQYVSHFIQVPFYVYAYSFGELLTLSIYQMAKKEGPGFVDKYVQVLKLGGARTPQELMAILGVDLGSRTFWEGGFAALDSMVGTFEELYRQYRA